MKSKFWIYVAGFIGVCFVVLAVGGLYFLTLQEGQITKAREKKNLFRQSNFYLKDLNRNLLKFEQEAEKSLEKKDKKESSLFAALTFVDLESQSIEPVLFPDTGKGRNSISKELYQEFLKFAGTLDQKAATKTSFHFLSDLQEGKGWIVFITPLQSFPKSRGLVWVGLVKSEKFFKFSKASDREALIINSQGRLFFSFQSEPGLFPSKATLKKFLKKAAQKKKKGWYVKRRGGDRQGSNLFHIRPWPGTNLFILGGGKFSQPLFAWTDFSALWGVFCFFLAAILFFGLVAFIKPLRSAYESLREEFIHLARTGERRSLPKSKNPFLSFYSSSLFSEMKKSSPNLVQESEPHPPFQPFQELLEKEEQRLRIKFPGLHLTIQLNTNMNLGHFHKSMRKILQELLLNAIEAMGSIERQSITVTTREEEEMFVLSIRDYGPGLNKEEKKKIFNLYYSTKSHLGVGLNLVQSIVSSHKGTIKLLSPSDGGLEVQVSLPAECVSVATNRPSSFKEETVIASENRKSFSSRALH